MLPFATIAMTTVDTSATVSITCSSRRRPTLRNPSNNSGGQSR
jgi:hypothetical protein